MCLFLMQMVRFRFPLGTVKNALEFMLITVFRVGLVGPRHPIAQALAFWTIR